MREIYSVDAGRRGALKGPYRAAGSRRRRLNKKKFAVKLFLLFILILIGILGSGFILKQLNIGGPITDTFSTVEKLFDKDPAATEKPAAEIPEATPAAAADPSGPSESVSGAVPSQAAENAPDEAENTNLPAFLQSGQGDMKAFSIDGIDPERDKVVALTFDDGPNPSTTGQILDALSEYGGRATFFVLGNRAEQCPDTVKKIYENGNEIGNHSYDHQDFKKLSSEDMLQEIEKTNDIVFGVVGARPILVRPPYGSISQELAEEIGKACVLWTVDPEDWKHRDADIDYDNVMSIVKDGDVVLMHDIYQESAKAAKRIIKDLTEDGYKLVTVSQMIQIAEARGKDVGLVVGNLRVEKDKV